MTTPARIRRLREVLARRQPDLTVLMEAVHKRHNFAAILRSCDAVGVHRAHAVLAEDGMPLSRGVSGSARKWVRVRRHDAIVDAIEHLRERGFTVLAAHPAEDAADFRDVDYTRPTAVLVGTELDGVSDAGLGAVDGCVRIPMLGVVPSLNVSVAAAVILFEAARQRREAGMYDRPRLEPDELRRTLFEWVHPRVARMCRDRGAPYPRLGPDGEILDPIPR